LSPYPTYSQILASIKPLAALNRPHYHLHLIPYHHHLSQTIRYHHHHHRQIHYYQKEYFIAYYLNLPLMACPHLHYCQTDPHHQMPLIPSPLFPASFALSTTFLCFMHSALHRLLPFHYF